MLGIWWSENYYVPKVPTAPPNVEVVAEVPNIFWPSSTTGALVKHDYYMLSYHEAYEQAEWVAYVLDRSHLTFDKRNRPYFIQDPKVDTESADWRNYKGSGYDRGHLVPAGDRRFSKQAYDDTFYTSNISPQDRDFNAGVWNRLEQQVRKWAKTDGPLVVVTAGILSDDLATIGKERVAVPRYFYKIVTKGEGDKIKMIAFLVPNKKTGADLRKFAVTVDYLEEMTGIDFFEGLPDGLEDKLESTVNMDPWKF